MNRTPLKRSEFKRKPAKPKKRPANPCSWSSRCKRRVTITLSEEERFCSTHATWTAKKLVGDFVKARDGGRCVLAGAFPTSCLGDLQWAHLIPQGRYPCLRYEPDNAIAACLRHHTAFDKSPVERELWMRRWLGPVRYDELQAEAVRGERVDLVGVIERFRKLAA